MTRMNPAVATFVEEAREQIEGLEAQLLDLESHATGEAVDAVFRVLHTIKGSGAMFGFTELSRFTHHFEEAFDRVRDGRARVDPQLVSLSLEARDHIRALLDLGGDGPEAAALATAPRALDLIARLDRLVGGIDGGTPDAVPAPALQADAVVRVWRVDFRPEPNALRNGMRPDLLLAELAGLGEVLSCVVDTSAVPDLETLDPMLSYLAWTIRLSTSVPLAEIEAVFIFADDARLSIVAEEEAPSVQTLSGAGGAQAAGPAKDAAPPPRGGRQVR